jgi:23S rRNA pseudouridine1911/1915/1917 synthase
LRGASLVECRLETGRTHQIRIHLSERGHPLVGERVYSKNYKGELIPAPRLMLHARELAFDHPTTGQRLSFEQDLPPDMLTVLTSLRG